MFKNVPHARNRKKERKKERNAARMQEKDVLNVNSLNII